MKLSATILTLAIVTTVQPLQAFQLQMSSVGYLNNLGGGSSYSGWTASSKSTYSSSKRSFTKSASSGIGSYLDIVGEKTMESYSSASQHDTGYSVKKYGSYLENLSGHAPGSVSSSTIVAPQPTKGSYLDSLTGKTLESVSFLSYPASTPTSTSTSKTTLSRGSYLDNLKGVTMETMSYEKPLPKSSYSNSNPAPSSHGSYLDNLKGKTLDTISYAAPTRPASSGSYLDNLGGARGGAPISSAYGSFHSALSSATGTRSAVPSARGSYLDSL